MSNAEAIAGAVPEILNRPGSSLLMPPRLLDEDAFSKWWARNHPHDWWARERSGDPLPDADRLLVWNLVRLAFLRHERGSTGRHR